MSSKTTSRAILLGGESDESVFLRQNTLLQHHVPFSAATLWRLVKAGRFPRPVKVTDQISAWRCSDVKKWAENPGAYLADAQGGRS
jgi:predicted DNA-binding transcriptional regulator AlpA